jgi:hypothetical protein
MKLSAHQPAGVRNSRVSSREVGSRLGALFGGMRRARERRESEQAQQSYMAQQQGALAQGRSNYERAFGACMAGRGYTVR